MSSGFSGLLSSAVEEDEEEKTEQSSLPPAAEKTRKEGFSSLLKKTEKISKIRETTKGLYSEEAEEPVEDRELLEKLGEAGASEDEQRAAHSLLRPKTVESGISGVLSQEPIVDPAFKLIESPKVGGEFGVDDVVNFLVGDEMAIIGMKYDNNGFAWDWEIARSQWAEQPLWVNLLATASLVGTVAFPAMKAVQTSAKFGRIGTLLGKHGDRAVEVAKWKSLGAIDNAVPIEEVTDTTLRQIRRLEHARSKHLDFEAKKIAEMEDNLQVGLALPSGKTLGAVEKLKWQFDKRFTNSYFENIASISENGQVKKEFLDNLDKLWKNEKLGRFFVDVPDAARGTAIYANMMLKSAKQIDLDAVIKRANPGMADSEVLKLKNSLKLNPEEQRWADQMWDAMKSHQDEALREGFITPEMQARIGQIHLPAFSKETPVDLASRRTMAVPIKASPINKKAAPPERILKTFEFPRLDAPQIRHRASEIGDVAERLFKGELLTSPEKLTFGGYVTDRLLLNNFKFMRDHAIKFGRKEDDVVKAFGSVAKAEEKGWVSLSKLRNGVPEVEATLKRMLKVAGHDIKDGEMLPFIHKSHYESMFGKGGLFEQTQIAGNLVELLTTIHKTSKTVFNIPTHVNNLVGNFSFLAMAGYNPLAPSNLNTMKEVTGAFIKWANAHDGIIRAGKKADGLYDPVTKRIRGVNLGKVKIGNKTFDLNDEFLDPMVKDVIGEESAFLHAEGLAVVQRFLDHAKKGSLTKAVAETMIKVKDMNSFTSKTFDYMTKAYLGEDVVPKLAYYLDLRAKGMSKEWAVLEVGRRLPVYSTVGSAIQSSRRVFLPWATFPAEATRIMKNNITDNPIAVMPWLHLPALLQTGMAATGLGPETYEEAQERTRQLPTWAQTATTVVAGPEGSNVAARAATGAMGGLIGGALGGAGGAAAGAAAGAILPPEMSTSAGLGAGVGALLGGTKGAVLGGIVGGAAGSVQALSEDRATSEQTRGAVLRWLPWSALTPASNSPEYIFDAPGVLAQLPVEPLAILRPAIEILSGRTGMGQEISSSGPGDMLGKMFAGTLGMLMPPFFQKYGFKITTPDQPITQLLVGGEGLPGDITNVSRFLTDTGQAVDPISGHPGNLTFDFLMNNTNGLWQSYAVKPEVRLLNEARQESALTEIRSHYGKQLAYYAQNNDWATASEITERVFSTFSRQYAADPGMAQEKFGDWMKRYIRAFGRHPGLRNMSEEELQARFDLASKHARESRSEARKDLMRVIERERRIRKEGTPKQKFLY